MVFCIEFFYIGVLVLQKTSKANFWDVENLETALVMKEICRVLAGHMVKQLQSIERMHSSSHYYYYYYYLTMKLGTC